MGIPTYFKKIVKDNIDIIEKEEINIDNFYLDFNAIVYTVITKLTRELGESLNETSAKDFENMLLPNVINYLVFIINDVVKPKNLVYVSMDGVAPMAKIMKQRSRRFKSVYEKNYKKSMEKKYKTIIQINKWSTASISPGTIFMDKLCNLIIKSRKLFNCQKFILSGYKEVGEGEQKIIHYLKENYKNNKNQENNLIFSPDADLIILLLMTNTKGLFILRDLKDIQKNDEKGSEIVEGTKFINLSIDKCRKNISQEIGLNFDQNENLNDFLLNKIIIDYAFLTFMCGNDFVQTISFLRIKEGGLDLLFSIYLKIKTKLNLFLVNKVNEKFIINLIFFKELVKELSEISQEMLMKSQRRRHRTTRNEKIEINDFNDELRRFQHEDYFSKSHPQYETFGKLFNIINYYDENWIKQYNQFFELNPIESVCEEYMKSLQFCLDYYTSKNHSWNFYYKFRTIPSFKDLYEYLEKTNLTEFTINDNSTPLNPFEQLSIILPKDYFYLLPKELKEKLLSLSSNYRIELDVVQGQKFIYSEILQPEPNFEFINIVKSFNFNPIDLSRNTLL